MADFPFPYGAGGGSVAATAFQLLAADPGAPANGAVWYNTTDDRLRAREDGVTITFAAETIENAALHIPGADPSVKINTAIAALPAEGGTIDCRGFKGNHNWSQTVTFPTLAVVKPVRLIFGNATFTASAGLAKMFDLPQTAPGGCEGSAIIGAGPDATVFKPALGKIGIQVQDWLIQLVDFEILFNTGDVNNIGILGHVGAYPGAVTGVVASAIMRNIFIVCNDSGAGANKGVGIQLDNVEISVIEECYVAGFDTGVWFGEYACNATHLNYSRVENCKYSVKIDRHDDIWLRGNTFQANPHGVDAPGLRSFLLWATSNGPGGTGRIWSYDNHYECLYAGEGQACIWVDTGTLYFHSTGDFFNGKDSGRDVVCNALVPTAIVLTNCIPTKGVTNLSTGYIHQRGPNFKGAPSDSGGKLTYMSNTGVFGHYDTTGAAVPDQDYNILNWRTVVIGEFGSAGTDVTYALNVTSPTTTTGSIKCFIPGGGTVFDVGQFGRVSSGPVYIKPKVGDGVTSLFTVRHADYDDGHNALVLVNKDYVRLNDGGIQGFYFRITGGGTQAAQLLTFSGQPANGDTVTIAGKVYTFDTVLVNVDGHVVIGAAATDSRDNLDAAIRLLAGAGTKYAAATTIHLTVFSGASGANLLATAYLGGTTGNSIAVSDSSANLLWGGATLTGGVGDGAGIDYDGQTNQIGLGDIIHEAGYRVTIRTQTNSDHAIYVRNLGGGKMFSVNGLGRTETGALTVFPHLGDGVVTLFNVLDGDPAGAGLSCFYVQRGRVVVTGVTRAAVTPPAAFAVSTGAHTAITASTEVVSTVFDYTLTKTWATGALATQRECVFYAPTYAVAAGVSQVITTAATVVITGAPIAAAGGTTITNSYAFWVQTGRIVADGGLLVGAEPTGVVGKVGYTNTVDNAANSTGVGTILFKGATSRNSSGFLKILDGVTPRFLAYFDAIVG